MIKQEFLNKEVATVKYGTVLLDGANPEYIINELKETHKHIFENEQVKKDTIGSGETKTDRKSGKSSRKGINAGGADSGSSSVENTVSGGVSENSGATDSGTEGEPAES